MRIAFVGKGGSGKTTLSSLFIQYLLHQELVVLAVDADINQHLCSAVGPVPHSNSKRLGLYQKELKSLFAGTNERIDAKKMLKTTPPGKGSTIYTGLKELVSALDDYTIPYKTGHFMQVGEQTDDDVGIRCYHSKTGAVELMLNHVLDQQGEYIVVDMTAGADAFASGLFDKFDLTIVVVEPTSKSLAVFKQYATQAKKLGVTVKAIGNKVIDDADRTFLQEELGDDLIGAFEQSAYVRKTERGQIPPFEELEASNRKTLDKIKNVLDAQEKDWNVYLERSIEIHRKNAESWGNASMGEDLTNQIDPTYSYPSL